MTGDPKYVSSPEFLRRTEPLTRVEWIQLIQARIDFLKLHFSKMSLPALGQMEVVRTCCHGSPQTVYLGKLGGTVLTVSGAVHRNSLLMSDFSLSTHCIFSHPYSIDDVVSDKKFWVLTRRGTLAKGIVHMQQSRCSICGETVESVLKSEVEETDIEGLLKHLYWNAYEFFEHLRSSTLKWENDLRCKVDVVRAINEELAYSSQLLNQINNGQSLKAADVAFRK